jgi:hypothetical protein
MSYSRKDNTSDVYVFGGADGLDETDPHTIVCSGCTLLNADAEPWEASTVVYTKSDAIRHFSAHLQRGDIVPDVVFQRIREDGWLP